MSSETATESDRWIRSYLPGPAEALHLVHFPHAGGSASYYRPFCTSLSDRFNALALQYPGRQDRRDEPCVTDLHVLADLLFDRLRQCADRPMAFFGHSMGALLAFEVTRRFERELNTSPVALFLSGRRAPSRHRDENVDLSSKESLLAEIRELSGTDPRLLGDDEMLEMIMEPLRADYRALGAYRFAPQPPVRCPVTVLTGADDPVPPRMRQPPGRSTPLAPSNCGCSPVVTSSSARTSPMSPASSPSGSPLSHCLVDRPARARGKPRGDASAAHRDQKHVRCAAASRHLFREIEP
nr:alpha/beta fold hydrolase [Streptomyces sioyaensis]